MQIESPTLNFLLLVLRIPLDLSSDISYKQYGFSKVLSKKSFKFVLSSRDNIVAFYLNFVLLLAEVNLISKKQCRKKDVLLARGISYIKMLLALSTK